MTLSGVLELSRNAVWKQIQTLRAQGYIITGGPNQGYLLEGSPIFSIPGRFAKTFTPAVLATKYITSAASIPPTRWLRTLAAKDTRKAS